MEEGTLTILHDPLVQANMLNLGQGCTNLGRHVAVAIKCWIVAFDVRRSSSVRNLPHVILWAPRIFRWLLEFF